MIDRHLSIPYDEIAAFCQRHHIRKLSLFGSVLRDDFREDSDVDVLVEFEEGHVPGWSFISMGEEFAQILGREVDFLTPGFLSEYFRDDVLQSAEVIYEQTR